MKPKQHQLIQTAQRLFSKYGMRRVTVEEICRQASVSKVTFYKYFKNKTDLLKCIIELMSAQALERYKSIMSQDVDFSEKAKELVRMKMEQTEGMSQEFMNDMIESHDPEIADSFRRMTQERFAMITRDFTAAQDRGEIRQDVKPEFMLYMLHKLLELVRDENLSSMYANAQDLSVELTNFFFYGIISRPGEET